MRLVGPVGRLDGLDRLQRVPGLAHDLVEAGPRVLAQTGYQVAVANMFGRHSDTRLIEALASQPQAEFDYSAGEGDFWLDYVADIGDGWNSTYAIADAIGRPELPLEQDGVNLRHLPHLVLSGVAIVDAAVR